MTAATLMTAPRSSAKPTVWATHLVARNAFHAVATELEAHAIPVLPVKGLVTAHALYDDVAERPIRDVDVRLRRRDFARAVEVGTARGWHKKHVALLGQVLWSVDGFEVDVKSELGPPGLCALPMDEVIARARTQREPFDFPHLEPEWNDHALMLALNVFKDGFASTEWALEDIRRIARDPRFDPEVLVGRAYAGKVATALWIVSDWLVQTEGLSAWEPVRERIGSRPPSPRLAGLYGAWRRLGCPRRVGHFLVPVLTDGNRRRARALGLASAGIVRGYGLRLHGVARGAERRS